MDYVQSLGKKQFITGLIAFAMIWFAGLIPFDNLFQLFTDQYNGEILKDAFIQFIGTGVVIILAFKWRMQDTMGFCKPKSWRSLLLVWPLILLSVLNIPESFDPAYFDFRIFTTMEPYTHLFFVISVGMVEEVIARSMVAVGLLRIWGTGKRGLYKSALVSSAIFGLVHFGNYFVYNYNLTASLTQVLVAFFFGVFFFALFVRTKSIWPGVVLHGVVDLCVHIDVFTGTAELIPPSLRDFSKTPEQFLVSVAVTLPLLIIGLLMLRKD